MTIIPRARRLTWLPPVGLLAVIVTGGLTWTVTHSVPGPSPAGSPAMTPSAAAPARERTVSAPPDAIAGWNERWQRWRLQLAEPGPDDDLAAELEAFVETEPALAFDEALKERDPHRRAHLIQSILLLWAGHDPAAAAARAHALPDGERTSGAAAVIAGAAGDPDIARRIAADFCRKDPSSASDYGYALISTLGQSGEFRAAVRFALGDATLADDEDHHKWLKSAFTQWAAQDPAAAMTAIQALPGEGARFEALAAIATLRLRTDPTGIAETLRALPAGTDRALVLGQTLRAWANQDPKTAADWLDRVAPSEELDAGAAAVAVVTQSHTVDRRPEVALSWAESIVGTELRSRTLATVVQAWSATDPSAALRYVRNSTDLLPGDRAALVSSLSTRPVP